ncbi:hypothetical protein B9Z19DRAFT_1090883 [Tuber borchii]|uniref:Uncharacterized protein n=1 Tax=Tuber borchii TaxID=42251 RepID=A0A2T6ZIC0_TUBBO|nr:hypothetical protein B9Z19DRAFT_1090883 [Tuber borchii]
MVEVWGIILRDERPIKEVMPESLYRGTYTDYENTIQRTIDTNASAYGLEQQCCCLSLKGVVLPR